MSNRFRLDTGCIIDQQENKVLSDVQVRNLLNKLNDENEELKQDVTDTNMANSILQERVEHYRKENEQLKNNIKEAYNNERTMIGKSVLKQLMETIQ